MMKMMSLKVEMQRITIHYCNGSVRRHSASLYTRVVKN